MIATLNFKPYQRGSILGFFDLRYHGLTVKGCRLMNGTSGYWFAFPQREGTDQDGKTVYHDQLYLSNPERDHVRRLVVAELEAEGHIQHQVSKPPAPASRTNYSYQNDSVPPEHVTDADDDLPF